jgi:hypothetical protein
MFPYISKLLDQLVTTNSPFAETALKKALKYNKETYKKLRALILSVKNDEYYASEYMKDMWIKACQQDLDFYDDGDIVMFRSIYSSMAAMQHVDGIITNVPHVTKVSSSPTLKHLAEELNDSYMRIKDITQHLEEI